MADVFEARRPEKGIRNGVGQHVGVGVPRRPLSEGSPPLVRACGLHRARRRRARRHRARPASRQDLTGSTLRARREWLGEDQILGEVSLILVFSPATISTRPPSRSTRESSVAARRNSSGESWRRRSRPRWNAWGVWIAHRFVLSRVSVTTPSPATLMVSETAILG